MAEKGRHFKSAKHGIALGSVGLAFGLILILAPGSGSTEGGTWSAALGIPTWGLGAALVVISGFILFLESGRPVSKSKRAANEPPPSNTAGFPVDDPRRGQGPHVQSVDENRRDRRDKCDHQHSRKDADLETRFSSPGGV